MRKLCLALMTALAACGGEGNADDDGTGGKSDGDDNTFETIVGAAPRSDGLTIASVAVEGNQLVVGVRYGGGCEEHDFALYWNGSVFESHPPQVDLFLMHDDHGDACEGLVGKTLRFDVARLAPGELRVWVDGYDEGVTLH